MEDDASSSNLHNPQSGWHKNVTVTSSPVSPCNPLADWCGAEYDAYKVVIDVYVVLAVCAVGFVGNALTVAVLRRDNDPTNTTNWLLQSLAFTDTLYLLSALVIQALKAINENTTGTAARALHWRLPIVEPHCWAIASTAQTFAVWLVLLITVDRYLAVCRPTHKQLRSVRRARLAAACLLLAAVLYNIPRFLERRTETCLDLRFDLLRLTNRHTALRQNRLYFLLYKTIIYIILRSFGPLAVLVALNVILVRTLSRVRRTSRRLSATSRHRENVTLLITVVVGVFVICQIPAVLVRIVFTVGEFWAHLMPPKCLLKYANAIANTLLTINSSVNFLIYCLLGRKFRAILADMCCCCPQVKAKAGSGEDPLLLANATAKAKVTPHAITNGVRDLHGVTATAPEVTPSSTPIPTPSVLRKRNEDNDDVSHDNGKPDNGHRMVLIL